MRYVQKKKKKKSEQWKLEQTSIHTSTYPHTHQSMYPYKEICILKKKTNKKSIIVNPPFLPVVFVVNKLKILESK